MPSEDSEKESILEKSKELKENSLNRLYKNCLEIPYTEVMREYSIKREGLLDNIKSEKERISSIRKVANGEALLADTEEEIKIEEYSSFLRKVIKARKILFVLSIILAVTITLSFFAPYEKLLLASRIGSVFIFTLIFSIFLRFPMAFTYKIYELMKKAEEDLTRIKEQEEEKQALIEQAQKSLPKLDNQEHALDLLEDKILSGEILNEIGPFELTDEGKDKLSLFYAGLPSGDIQPTDIVKEDYEIYRDLSERLILPEPTIRLLSDLAEFSGKIYK